MRLEIIREDVTYVVDDVHEAEVDGDGIVLRGERRAAEISLPNVYGIGGVTYANTPE